MKKIFFFLTFLMSCFCLDAQNKKSDIPNDKLYLNYNYKNIKFSDIKKTTIIKLLGKPIKIKNEKWETTEANECLTYVYPNGEISFEDGVLSFIDLNKSGWALIVKDEIGLYQQFTVGSDDRFIARLFPAWPHQRNNMINVTISINGNPIEEGILFELKGHTVTHIHFFTDES